tara:strand:- start:300 stop:503 length:204 start_codon:yes stop_codon:yes gene_type:complete
MNKKAMEGLKQEQANIDRIYEIKKEIRHLEIELDYIEDTDSYNFKYISYLESKIDNLYEEMDKLNKQ